MIMINRLTIGITVNIVIYLWSSTIYESWDDPPIGNFFAWDLPPPFGGVPRVREGATAKEIRGEFS